MNLLYWCIYNLVVWMKIKLLNIQIYLDLIITVEYSI